MSSKESYICNGGNYSILLESGFMILRPKAGELAHCTRYLCVTYDLVIVERKSVMPFAT